MPYAKPHQTANRGNLECFSLHAGLLFLTVAKTKHLLLGYTTSKPIPATAYDESVAYTIRTVERWLTYLREYTGQQNAVAGKDVLELGPGSDLGVGLYLLAKGANSYTALDVNNLISDYPEELYSRLFSKIAELDPTVDVTLLRQQLELQKQDQTGKLRFVQRKDFDISATLAPGSIDVIVSQAAFEHFDDVEVTIQQMSSVVRAGGLAAILVDLTTHTRGIRELDKLNIYRYSPRIFKLFKFSGIPNRVRPYIYQTALEKYGWEDVCIHADSVVPEATFQQVRSYLHASFQDDINQMTYLSIMICARK